MGAGRDQRGPMERLTQILFVLSRSPERTATSDRLLEHVEYGADRPEDRRRQLMRDIGHLTELGWEISSVGADGEPGRYRLVAGDLRLRVDFSAAEQAELQRAARVAQLSGIAADLGPAEQQEPSGRSFVPRADDVGELDAVQRAVSAHCLLSFDYRGRSRTVHPHRVHLRTGGWYLRARAVDEAEVKTFRLDRMEQVVLGQPGTAEVPPTDAHLRIDPIAWQVDPPLVAVLGTTAEHAPQVAATLAGPDPTAVINEGTAGGAATGRPGDTGAAEEVVLRVRVSNRAAFRGRLYELGVRVRLLGPAELREEVRAHLLAVAGGRR